MIDNQITTKLMTQRLIEALPKLFDLQENNLQLTTREFFQTGTLIGIMPSGLMIEKRSDPSTYHKVRYPKMGCSMTTFHTDLPEALGLMILILARNGYMKEYE